MTARQHGPDLSRNLDETLPTGRSWVPPRHPADHYAPGDGFGLLPGGKRGEVDFGESSDDQQNPARPLGYGHDDRGCLPRLWAGSGRWRASWPGPCTPSPMLRRPLPGRLISGRGRGGRNRNDTAPSPRIGNFRGSTGPRKRSFLAHFRETNVLPPGFRYLPSKTAKTPPKSFDEALCSKNQKRF